MNVQLVPIEVTFLFELLFADLAMKRLLSLKKKSN